MSVNNAGNWEAAEIESREADAFGEQPLAVPNQGSACLMVSDARQLPWDTQNNWLVMRK